MIIYTDVPEPENEFLRVRFLCLLCERKLLEEEFYGHVFSREHVENFLVSIKLSWTEKEENSPDHC